MAGPAPKPGLPTGLDMDSMVYANRLMGHSADYVARVFGISEEEVDAVVERRAARLKQKLVQAPDVPLALELDRLDAILQGVFPLAQEGRKDAVDSFVKLGDRRDRLLGLHLEATRKGFLDPTKNDDVSDLTDEEIRVLENISTRRAAKKAGGSK